MRHIFNSLFGIWNHAQTRCFMFDLLLEGLGNRELIVVVEWEEGSELHIRPHYASTAFVYLTRHNPVFILGLRLHSKPKLWRPTCNWEVFVFVFKEIHYPHKRC